MGNLLEAFSEALLILYKGDFNKEEVMRELDLMMLAFDETVDDGIILTCEASAIVERVCMKQNAEIEV